MQDLPYYSFSTYLKKYPYPVYKATIDAGFICPNMDGTKGVGGCTFCNNASFSPAFILRKDNIKEQLERSITEFEKSRQKLSKRGVHFIAFFQAFSGTYGPLQTMKEWWEEALSHPRILGLSVSTRCDCFTPEIFQTFKLLASQNKEIWIELGVESTHNKTLQRINRGHSYEELIDAVKEIKKIPQINLCLHLIHGLPGETREMMLESVEKVNALNPTAIKFHHLEIVKDTVLAKEWIKDPFPLFSLKEYFVLLGESLQRINPEVIIQRLFSHSPKDFLIAPIWEQEQQQTQLFIDYMKKNKIKQGDLI